MSDETLSFASVVIACAFYLSSMQPAIHQSATEYQYGFGGSIEKSALQTRAHDYEDGIRYTKSDVILSLAIADEYTPSPAKYNIDGVEIAIDNTFLKSRITNMKPIINNGVSENTEYTISTSAGKDSPDYWSIERK